jgi:hypothetical protein
MQALGVGLSERNEMTERARTWSEYRAWAEELIATHSPDQVADTLADVSDIAERFREGMAAEARIIEAQVLSLSNGQLGKGRRKIVTEQVRRMYDAALDRGLPRSYGSKWWEKASEARSRV